MRCPLDISRITLYRAYRDIAERVRRRRRKGGYGRLAAASVVKMLRKAIAGLRSQLARRSTLADFYFVTAEAQRPLVARRS